MRPRRVRGAAAYKQSVRFHSHTRSPGEETDETVLAGMVAMGEYSDGCICQVPSTPKANPSAVSGAGPAVAGVWIQMQEAEQQAQASQVHHAGTR